jgi:methionyl-tRNA formyltransferase
LRVRVVFFGMSGVFSARPLAALLADERIDVRAVALPALAAHGADVAPVRTLSPVAKPARALPQLTPVEPGLRQLAAAHGIPALELADLGHPATLATLAGFAPDAICVACFPRRLPLALLRLPPLGALNVHPSLLPDNRGPDPLFWTFQRGDTETGVSIHLMDEGLDTGPLLAQERVAIAEGIGEARLERLLAERGGRLLAESVQALAAETARPTPQDERRATQFGFPRPEDYTIHPEWPARRAYTFASGLIARGVPLMVVLPEARFQVIEPLGYEPEAALGEPWHLTGDVLRLQCAPGVFIARIVQGAGK